ncbi:MAG: M48 family metallopeptidase [Deltaproteobacteria bacterium]|nr:M48 family metallopeptidase [Deltaproteobacteria bacterium]MBT4526191.1 M48 family metallopeptidase [Deltaproteobacteria bacterium]
MTPSLIFKIIIVILILNYCIDRLLDYLNATRRSSELPEELEGIYNAEKYRKSQEYDAATSRFSFITSTYGLALMLGMLFFSGFAYVDQIAVGISENPILRALIFFGVLMLASDILSTPFSIYRTFVIEEKFGFNKTTPKTFILDKIKGWLLSAIVGGGLLSLIIWFYMLTTTQFWIYAWMLISGFSIFMVMFYSSLIVPLFNKQTPLEAGDLRNAIEAFSNKVGFALNNIFVIDGSKRSTKANAYFSGLGSKKRIVLFDTLIADLNIKELVAVLAHEIGHYKKKHTRVSIIFSIIQMGLMLFVLSFFISKPELSQALGVSEASFHIGIITFGMLYDPFSTILAIGMNVLSRKNEYQADSFAKEQFNGEDLGNALKKLSVKNLSNLTPHPAYVFMSYSHPPLLSRLAALNK